MIELKIYVPRPSADQPAGDEIRFLHILRGSGIVGSPDGIGIRIDYEGNHNGACNIKTWEDKVFHAAGRHVSRYPTIARSVADAGQLIEIGSFRCEDNWMNPVYEITNQAALDAW